MADVLEQPQHQSFNIFTMTSLLKRLSVASSLAFLAMADVLEEPQSNGNCTSTEPETHPEQIEIRQRFAAKEKSTPWELPAVPDNIDVYMHVIAASEAVSDGYIANETLTAQLDVINHHFRGVGFFFTQRNATWSIGRNWTYFRDEWTTKKTLRQGDYNALNLYYFKGETKPIPEPGCPEAQQVSGNLGYCNYPTDEAVNFESDFMFDGCLVSVDTVPGGPRPNLNTGKMAVHEVGHWFGLSHTFQNDDGLFCKGAGDVIDDTPPQRYALSGCNATANTCGDPRGDPIRNFMGYSDDACKEEFTPGQIRRMRSYWDFRKSINQQIEDRRRPDGTPDWIWGER